MGKKYGLFNSKYLGASIYCDESYKLDALRDFVLNKSNDYYVGNKVLNEENTEDVFLYNTTYFHEARHVHEHLLCPVLNYMLRLNILCSLHSIQFFINWNHVGGRTYNFIPIPLNDWFNLDDDAKQFNINCWKNSIGLNSIIAPEVTLPRDKSLRDIAEVIIKNPHANQDSLNNLLIIAAAYYEEYKNFQRVIFDKSHCEYSVRAFLESSAFVHQMSAISLMYGEAGNDYVSKTLQNIFKNKNFSVYTGIFTFIYRYLYYTGFDLQFQYPVTSYILYWCLCGNVLSPYSIIDPVKRLDLFTKQDLLHNINFTQLYNSPLTYFDCWDKAIGSTPIDYNLYERTVAHEYDKITQTINEFSNSKFAGYSRYIEALKKSTVLMIEQFKENPSKFLMPQSYLENIYDYVNVPAQFVVKDKSFSINANELKRKEAIIRESTLSGDCVKPEWIVSNCPRFSLSNRYELLAPTPNEIVLTHQISEDASPYLLLSDALFAPLSVTSPEQIIKMIIPDVEVGFIF